MNERVKACLGGIWREGLDSTGHGPALRALAHEFLRFSIVGGVAVVIHYLVLIALVELGGLPVIVSTSLGYLCGATFSYTLNRRVTFKHQPGFGSGLVLYMVLGASGLLLNGALVSMMIGLGAAYMLAQVAATGVVTIWNFVVARLGVFRPRAGSPPQA